MKKELFDDLVESIKQARDICRGEIKPSRVFDYRAVDVKRIRSKLDVSQSEFAALIGVSKSTLQNWEQGRRKPQGPAHALLRIVDKNPKAALKALR